MRIGRTVTTAIGCGFTLTALGVAVARFFETSPLVVKMAALGPVGAVLAGIGAAIFAGLLVGRSSRTGNVALATSVVILVAHLWWFAPFVTGGQPIRPPDTVGLTILSVNLRRGDADARQIVATAKRDRVDILVLSEITPEALGALERRGLSEVLPYRAGAAARATSGTMVFLRTPAASVRRIATHMMSWELTTTIQNRLIRLLAVHAMPPGDVGSWQRDLRAVEAVARTDAPELIVGDLNATADHPSFRRLVGVGYRDVVELVNGGWRPTWPAAGAVSRLGIPVPTFAQIDHVLVGGRPATRGGAERAWTVHIADTDHEALAARVWLPYAR